MIEYSDLEMIRRNNMKFSLEMVKSVKADYANPQNFDNEAEFDPEEIRRQIKDFLQSDTWEWMCMAIDWLDPEVAGKALRRQLK